MEGRLRERGKERIMELILNATTYELYLAFATGVLLGGISIGFLVKRHFKKKFAFVSNEVEKK